MSTTPPDPVMAAEAPTHPHAETLSSEELERECIALCERLVSYADNRHCLLVHVNLARDLKEAEACITLLADDLAQARATPPAVSGAEPYWFLENPQGEWLVCCPNDPDKPDRWRPTVTRDHTKAWRFGSRLAADECRRRVLWPEWNDEFWPTEHAAVSGAEGLREALDAARIAELVAEGDGFWTSCTGCHESNEGYPTGPFSKALQCHLGNGCSECGGIGAIWDDTDYEEMARFMLADEEAALKADQERVEDYVLVPREPTEAMLNAAWVPETSDLSLKQAIWAAMIAAAPDQERVEAGSGAGDPVNDPKYAFRDNRVWNRADGLAIPDDEPVFVFRARDRHAARVLGCYLAMVRDEDHKDAIEKRLTDFEDFASAHPERMKEPDTAALQQRPAAGEEVGR